MTKAKAALAYYEHTVKSDLLYYVGETTLQAFHENDEQKQEDETNFTELVAATALFDFLNRSKPQSRQYLTRAIQEDVVSLDLSTLGKGYAPLVKHLADFKILHLLLGVLPNEKYFPLKQTRGFDASFYNNDLHSLNEFMESFSKWYKELSMKKRAFGPVSDVSPNNMINIIKNYSGLDAQDDSYYLLVSFNGKENRLLLLSESWRELLS